MNTIKKLSFAPVFIISLVWLLYQFNPFLKSADLIFSFSLETLLTLILICLALLLSGLFFVIFAALALDWKLVIPIIIISALTPFLFLPQALALIFAVVILASLIISFMFLESKMKNYLTFSPTAIFIPSVKQVAGLLIIGLSLIYYLSINQEIKINGFQIPDSLIDTALKLMPQTAQNSNLSNPQTNNTEKPQIPQISQEQIDLAKKNPALLKQFGIDPKMLDSLVSTNPSGQNLTVMPVIGEEFNNLIKSTVKDQLQNILKPYQSYIPMILALLFFFSFQTILAFLYIFLLPLIWLIFLILEKTGFITFTTEMREVRKMVV